MSSRAASTSCLRLNVSHLNADRKDRQPGPSPAAPCGVQVPVLFRCFHGGNLGRGAPSARISVMEGSTPYSIKRKEVLPHGISVLFDQRHQPGQHLRHHRSGLHHGVRHRQDAELRPRRHHYDRRLCFLLLHVLFKSPPHRGHPAGSDRLHRPRHRDRAAGLCASALRPFSGGADHRHRRQLFPPELRSADLEGRRQDLSSRCRRRCAAFQRPAHHFLHLSADHRRLHRHHAGADHLRQQVQDGQGHACLLRG